MFETKTYEVTGCKQLCAEELLIFTLQHILLLVMNPSLWIKWTGHVLCVGEE
jgi:hypothetical protein